LARDGNKCHYCKIEFNFRIREQRVTVDHKIPLCEGGEDFVENLVLCCNWCNIVKSNAKYGAFFQFIAFLKEKLPNFPETKPAQYGILIKQFNRKTAKLLHPLPYTYGKRHIATVERIATLKFANKPQSVL
jgi:hypothetical protein